jgi:uncharacterized protein
VPALLPIALLSLFAGAANSIAGGGTLLTFPALIGLGIPPVVANATSTVALVPGSFTSMMGYREMLRGARPWIIAFAVPSVAGGALGAWLLVRTSDKRFAEIVPFLVLGATLLFMLQRPILRAVRRWQPAADAIPRPNIAFVAAQFLVAIYGGYFGAAAGIVMLAALGFMGLTDIHQMNGLKNWAAVCFNSVAALTFIASGLVDWPVAAVMGIGAAAGGWMASRLAQRVHPDIVRGTISVIGFAAAVWLFVR